MKSGLTARRSRRSAAARAGSALPLQSSTPYVRFEPVDAVDRAELVADAQRDRGGHVPAGRLAADQQAVGTELRLARRRAARARPRRRRRDRPATGTPAPCGTRPTPPRRRAPSRVIWLGMSIIAGRARDHPAAVEVEVDRARRRRRAGARGTARRRSRAPRPRRRERRRGHRRRAAPRSARRATVRRRSRRR